MKAPDRYPMEFHRQDGAPDRMNYITAWRAWLLLEPTEKPGPPCLLSVNSTYLAVDLRRVPTWPHRQALVAECAMRPQQPQEGPVWQDWQRSHRERFCGACGIYAYKPDAPEYAQSVHYYRVWGKVALWGHYVEHERGWRAEYAYPLELWVDVARVNPVTAWALQEAYGVPVHLAHRPQRVVDEGAGSVIHVPGGFAAWQFVGNQAAIYKPAQPPVLDFFEADSPTSLRFQWHGDPYRVKRFECEVSVPPHSWISVDILNPAPTGVAWNITWTGARPGTQYEGRVVAYTTDGQRLVSQTRTVTTPTPSAAASGSVIYKPAPRAGKYAALLAMLERYLENLMNLQAPQIGARAMRLDARRGSLPYQQPEESKS